MDNCQWDVRDLGDSRGNKRAVARIGVSLEAQEAAAGRECPSGQQCQRGVQRVQVGKIAFGVS
jgi:hypothetical protein